MALKDRVRVGSPIDKKLHQALKDISDETGIPMSKLLDEAITDLVVKYERRKAILAEHK